MNAYRYDKHTGFIIRKLCLKSCWNIKCMCMFCWDSNLASYLGNALEDKASLLAAVLEETKLN